MTTREFQQKKPLSILFTYFKPHRGLFILDLVCATVVALIDLAFPLVTRKSMYDLLPNQQYRTFFIVMGVMMAAFIVRALLYYVISYWGHTFGILVEADIRRDLFTHVQELDVSFFDHNRTGQLMSRLTSDLFEITELAHHGPEDLLISALTIVGAAPAVGEESKEFLRRLETGENLPLMTSCCPSWVRYVEQERPQFIKNLSSALSPMQMFATVLKDKYREKDAADGRTTFHIAIMPCTAKKMEAGREEFRRDGVPNVDLVLTTQEVIKMIKESGIRFQMLEKESPDLPFGMGSGAAEIFGTSGGVAEAVLRCCLPDKSKNVLRMLEHSGLRGTEAVRFVTIPVNGRDVRVALAHGLANAAKLLDQIENGEVEVDLVEVMSCRTGCVGGAGQPYALMSTKLKRAHGLYEIDRSAMFKRSERNPVLDAMYAAGLNERAHELLHHEYKD